MKKFLLILLSIVAIMFLSSCDSDIQFYTEEDVRALEYEAYKEGFDEGYDLRDYELRGEMEYKISKTQEDAYQVGYEDGYETGYEDALYDYDISP